MQARTSALGRLAAVYELVEHADGAALDQARAELHQVEEIISQRVETAAKLAILSREALERGDLREWQLLRSEMDFTQWNREALNELRAKRESARDAAAQKYQESRMRVEQMQSVLRDVQSEHERAALRAEQGSADERYLSRQHWEMQTAKRRVERAPEYAKEEPRKKLNA